MAEVLDYEAFTDVFKGRRQLRGDHSRDVALDWLARSVSTPEQITFCIEVIESQDSLARDAMSVLDHASLNLFLDRSVELRDRIAKCLVMVIKELQDLRESAAHYLLYHLVGRRPISYEVAREAYSALSEIDGKEEIVAQLRGIAQIIARRYKLGQFASSPAQAPACA